MYNGKFILRIEDTNPENIYPGAYQLIEKDIRWLTGNKVAEVIVQSSRLGIYYDYAEQLVHKGKAYVCICDADEWRELKNNAAACPCREINIKDNKLRYAKMFSGYAGRGSGAAVEGGHHDKNPAMRDFCDNAINEHVHPKPEKEQRVW